MPSYVGHHHTFMNVIHVYEMTYQAMGTSNTCMVLLH